MSCFAAKVAVQPAKSLTASSWQYSVRMGLPPYFRMQALACTPQSGARSVAVDANKPLLRIARRAESKYGAGVPNGSISMMSNLFLGEALQLKTQFASLCLTAISFSSPLSCTLCFASLYARSLMSLINTRFTPSISAAKRTPRIPWLVKGSQIDDFSVNHALVSLER